MNISQNLPHFLENFWLRLHWKIEKKRWVQKGMPSQIPHLEKQRIISHYGRKHKLETFVETGTYKGEMILSQLKNFKWLYSIELSERLANRATRKFRGNNKVKIITGDSSEKLKEVVLGVKGPMLFWLDGHYSGGITARGDVDCPIYAELDAIFENPNPNHVILIDDAREFNGTYDYPKVDEVVSYINKKSDGKFSFVLDRDVMCFEPIS